MITLLALAAASWGFLWWQAAAMRGARAMPMPGMPRSLTMGLGAGWFMAMWVVMMVAMMFPTAAPMVLAFAGAQAARTSRGWSAVPTSLFVAAYLLVWTALGVLAYGAATGVEWLASRSPWLSANAPRVGGAVLVVAGLYQLSPLKHACLGTCRAPWQFILTSWRDGWGGALRMGVQHGAYCLGCCWLLFAILFPLGIMNVGAMVLVTLLISAEKTLPLGKQIAWVGAAALIVYGALVMLSPGLLPTAM